MTCCLRYARSQCGAGHECRWGQRRRTSASGGYVLEARGLTKRYGPLLANKDVQFGVRRGEIVALLGENGAGKTTLMNMLLA